MKHDNITIIHSMDVLQGCTVSYSVFSTVNIFVILAVIPLLNQCVFPFLRNYTPNMLKRIGVGCVLIVLSTITLLTLTTIGQSVLDKQGLLNNATEYCMFTETDMDDPDPGFVLLPLSSFLSLIPQLLISVAEVFVNVSSKTSSYNLLFTLPHFCGLQ